ncbi:hypothetical protein RND71_010471 [Anisodus tanguticus]|uniref:NAC domain-containing protein n=1 Tax=Anisodus tanguticus TaxID=243964 RepID=A0AAE1SJV6_9SOLA|nr:hypothetical protein RND71_010471 [Anisodus tanguticus]
MNENCMNIEVIPKQEVVVGDQLSYADEELIIHYLDKKIMDQRFPDHTIHEVDFFLYHPQQLSQMYDPCDAKEWYFLSPASKKYTEGGQCNSSNTDGYWEPCGTVSPIHKDDKLIGYRRTLNFIEGKHEKRTEWLTHEYRLDRIRDVRTGTTSDDMQSSDKFLAAEEKEATTNVGVSSTDHTIQGPKANDLIDDKSTGPSNGRSCPVPETDQGSTMPYSSSSSSFDKPVTYSLRQHDQGTIVPTQHGQRSTVTGGQKATNNVIRNKRRRRKRDSHPPPASDQDFMMPNAKSQRTRLPLPGPVPKLPSVEGSPHGSHKKEDVAPRYDGWPLYTAERLPPFDGPFESLMEEELAFFDKPDPEYPQAYEIRKMPRND